MYQINCDLRKWTFMTSDGRERLTRNKIKKKGTAQGGGGGGGTTCTLELKIELSSDLTNLSMINPR